MPLRIIFMGTPDFAVPTLAALARRGSHDIAAVYCRAAKPSGRGMKLQPTPVEREAVETWADCADTQDAADSRG